MKGELVANGVIPRPQHVQPPSFPCVCSTEVTVVGVGMIMVRFFHQPVTIDVESCHRAYLSGVFGRALYQLVGLNRCISLYV